MPERLRGVPRALVKSSLFSALLALLLAPGVLTASPGTGKSKVPDPTKQFVKAYKNLARQKNYKVSARVLGGLSNNDRHTVVTSTTRESYDGMFTGSIRNPMMAIPGIKAYKTPKAGKGVIYYNGTWKAILSTQTGVKMDRLIDFPYLIMAEAAKYAKTARWLEKDEVQEGFRYSSRDDDEDLYGDEEEEDEAEEDEDDDDSERDKRRTSVKKSGDDAVADEDLPRVLRIEASPRSALATWIQRVENSGCMSEG